MCYGTISVVIECWSGSMLSGTHLLLLSMELWPSCTLGTWQCLGDKLCNSHIMVVVSRVLLLSTWHVQPSFKLIVQSPTVHVFLRCACLVVLHSRCRLLFIYGYVYICMCLHMCSRQGPRINLINLR